MEELPNPYLKTRKVQERGIARREQILDTARATLLSHGISGLVLRDIATQLGITHGNLQYYFSTKDDLLLAVFDRELTKYTFALQTAVARTPKGRERIFAFIDMAVAELKTDSTILWTMIISMAYQNHELATLLRQLNGKYDTALSEELSQVVPNWSKHRCLHTAQMIRMILDGLAVQLSYDDINSPEMIKLQDELKVAIISWFE